MNILQKLFEERGNDIVAIPDRDVFDCEIETPQFLGSQDKFKLHRQIGAYDKTTMKFTPFKNILGLYGSGNHEVQFHSQDDFQKALIKVKQ